MWNLRSKRPDYNKIFKSIKRRLSWEANWREADLLYQQLSNDKSFKKELLSFPNSKYKDQVDSLTQAISYGQELLAYQ
mgnify:CR=1 FL=1